MFRWFLQRQKLDSQQGKLGIVKLDQKFIVSFLFRQSLQSSSVSLPAYAGVVLRLAPATTTTVATTTQRTTTTRPQVTTPKANGAAQLGVKFLMVGVSFVLATKLNIL